MSRKGKISLGLVGLLLLLAVAVGGVTFQKKASVVRQVETFAATLPQGDTLTYDSVSAHLFSASAVLKNPVYTSQRTGLKVTADEALVGIRSLAPPRIDLQLKNPAGTQIGSPAPEPLFRAKTVSVEAIDPDWFHDLSVDMDKDFYNAWNVERWRTFAQGRVLVEDFVLKSKWHHDWTVSIAKVDMEGFDEGILTSLSLFGVESLSGTNVTRYSSLTQKDMDVAWFMGLVGDLAGEGPNVLSEAERLASLAQGPCTVSDLFLVREDMTFTVASVRLEGIKAGLVGQITLTDLQSHNRQGIKFSVGTAEWASIDLVRRLAARTTKTPNGGLVGLGDVSFEDVSIRPDPDDKAPVTIKRLALVDVTENAAGTPVAGKLVLKDLALPLADIRFFEGQKLAEQMDLEALGVSGEIGLAFEGGPARLVVDPLDVDFGDLGSLQGTLDVSAFDPGLLTGATLDRFARNTRLNGMTLTLKSGPKTERLMDVVLKDQGTSRDQAVVWIRRDLTGRLFQMMDRDLAGPLLNSLISFVQNPGTLHLSVRATGAPVSLADFGDGLARGAKGALKTYAIDVKTTN